VILPDATIALDYMQSLATRVVSGLVVHEDRMLENLELTSGALFSQRLLLALIEDKELVRDEAYRTAQELAQRAWDTRTPLKQLAAADERCEGLDLDKVFDLSFYTRYADEIVSRLDVIEAA
jgi:adenylosuccinate lyase